MKGQLLLSTSHTIESITIVEKPSLYRRFESFDRGPIENRNDLRLVLIEIVLRSHPTYSMMMMMMVAIRTSRRTHGGHGHL